MSHTAQFADVVLPGCPSVEKDGTFVNTERRIQRFYEVMRPLGEARPDWRILTELAARLGHDWGYQYPSEIMDEVAGIAELFAGVNYARLEGWRSLLWPVAKDGTDTPRLYTESFKFPDGRARLFPVHWERPAEEADQEYTLILDNGRLLEHFQSANQTGKSPGINQQLPEWFVEIGPDLAAQHDIKSGTWVRLTSRRGSVEVKALITDRVQGNTLYLPIHYNKPGMNILTGDHKDKDVKTPAYKETAVKLERLSQAGDPPMHCNNFRYGHPIATAGVETERKWARDAYLPPPARVSQPEKM